MVAIVVTWPEDVEWPWLERTPILSGLAREDILEIKQDDRGLAKQLSRELNGLLNRPLVQIAELISDPPGIGPRYMIDLTGGYVAVFWLLDPPPQFRGAPRAIWIEQVRTRKGLKDELEAEAPRE